MCVGEGAFNQQIDKGKIVLVGRVPIGINNVKIELKSPVDIDLVLLDISTKKTDDDPDAILSWVDDYTKEQGIRTALMQGGGYQQQDYHGLQYSWSGYNGVKGDTGYEVVQIQAKTNRELEMRVYG